MIKYLGCVIMMLFYVSSVMSANRLPDLEKLDIEISKWTNYLIQKDSLIRQLKYRLEQSRDDATSFYLADNVFDAYKSYQYDSAHVYARKTLAYAEKLQDADLILKAKANLLFCFFSGGDFKEANDVVQFTSVMEASSQAGGNSYALCARFYTDMLNFSRVSEYHAVYRNQISVYRDSVLSLLPDICYLYRLVEMLYDVSSTINKKIASCHDLLEKSPDKHQHAIICANLKVYLWIVGLLTMGAVLGILLIYKQKIKLKQAGEAITEQSHKLRESNFFLIPYFTFAK